jgi:hypothetical protein
MKNTLITIAGAAAILALAQTSQAVPINGNIGFGGSVTLNGGTVGTATGVVANGWNGTQVTVNSTSGTFTIIPAGTPVVMNASAWTFGTALASFWSIPTILPGFTFNLTSSTIQPSSPGFLNITLVGTVSDGTPADTSALFGSLSIQDPPANGTTTFTESLSFHSQPPSTPDGGTTLMLLGAAFSGIALIKRKLVA